jgi:hypothetical protein
LSSAGSRNKSNTKNTKVPKATKTYKRNSWPPRLFVTFVVTTIYLSVIWRFWRIFLNVLS